MRKIYMLFWLMATCLCSHAQLTGIKNIPGDYATITAAVTDLNTQGVGNGGVTFNVAAGYLETLTAPLLLTIATNPPSAARPVTFQRSGAGANPLITAYPGTSTTVDGMFVINGADYITVDGIDLQENPANTTATLQMEWGYALVKTSATNGSHYNTIKNCNITLNKANIASVGIYTGNHIAANTTALTFTSFAGTNSYNKFYSNTVQNCFHGIDLNGYTSAAAPFDLYDKGNEIGAIGSVRNQVLNFGGGATGTVNGITCNAQNLVKIFKTNIDNAGGASTSTTINGILTGSGTNVNVEIYNDTVTLSSTGTTAAMTGINNGSGGTGAGNTVSIYNCVVQNCSYLTATSAEFRGIAQTTTATTTNIQNNTVSGNTVSGTGQFSGIYYGGSSSTLVLSVNINNNIVSGNSKTGTSGQFNCIYANASSNISNFGNNQMFNNSCTSSSGIMYGYYNFAVGVTENVTNNQYYNNSSGSGTHIAFYCASGSAPTGKTISGNTMYGNSGTGQVGGIYTDYGTTVSINKNNIYDLTTTGATGTVFGILFSNASTAPSIQNTYNNFISDLKATTSNSTTAIAGISILGVAGSTYNLVNNTIYLNAVSSSATTFGTAGISISTTPLSVVLRNNIVVNNSTPGPTGGNTVALLRGGLALTNYSITSGNNCYYAGTPAANRLIYADGTNTDQTLQAFKNRVGYREQASFSEMPPFVNIATAPYDLHLQTGTPSQCEMGGQPVALVTTDFDGNTRNASNPDVGADELNGTTNDIASPDIQYSLLGNSDVAATRTVASFATITDPSGINVTAGTKPRLYFKKSTQANTFNDNTSATDGWKYVEASNAASPFSFTIDYSLLLGGSVVAGDIIQYFVTAQDLNATPRIGLNNGGFTTQPASVNLAAANFPLTNTIHQYTIVANSFTGVIPVGPGEAITSLTNTGGMFDLINNGTVKGNITLSITGNLTAETGTVALNQWNESGGSNFTVTIAPSAAAIRTISGSHSTLSLIRLDGADRVTIDGRFGGSGSYITLRNTSNTAPTIGFINDAQGNTVRNCIIESGNTATSATAGGAVFIGTTTGLQGNDNITITNNEIRDRSDVAGTPSIGINCAGNVSSPAQANSGITISNNTIHDWYLLNGTSQFGITIATGNTNFIITGNSFYQTATRSHTAAGAVTRAININNASAGLTSGGHDVSGNFIGGTAPGATGSDWTLTSTSSQTFTGINITTGMLPVTVRNNVITKINYTSIVPAAAVTMFAGISVAQGNFTVEGNTIGSATATGAITIALNTGGTVSNFLAGVLAAAQNGTFIITGNSIGGWTLAGTNTTALLIPQYIQVQGTPSSAVSITNNIIGSTTIANSINNTLTAANCISFGIRLVITSGAPATISGNTLQNITDQSTNANASDYGILLISSVGSQAPLTVTNNTISNFSGNGAAAAPTINTYGISLQGFNGNGHVFTGNTLSNISNNNTGAFSGYAIGLQVQGSSTGGTISKNRIFNIANANTGVSPGLAGIYLTAGDGWSVENNMVSINNGAGTNALNVYGIADYSAGTTGILYNSAYVGGTGSGGLNTYAFLRGNNSKINLKNNLLYNERTGGAASHYAVGNLAATPGDGWTSNSSSYNTFITSSPAAVGEWGTNVQRTFAQWKTSSGGDVESYADIAATVPAATLFTNTAAGDLNINTASSNSWYVNGKGIAGTASNSINSDFAGTVRGITVGTPTDIGADEFTPDAGVLPPDAIASAAPALSTTTTYTFGGRTLGQITWGGTGTVPTSITWKYYSGIQAPGYSGAINSYHDVPNTLNDGSGFTYSMKLYYTLAEQNQYADPTLEIIKKDGASPWVSYGGTPTADADGKFVNAGGFSSFSLFSLKTNLVTLPVRVLSFNGRTNGEAVDLVWDVAEQTGIRQYAVERSSDGINYITIGTVTANTADRYTYSFTDGQPLMGKNHYRLRIIEIDNRFTHSKTLLFTFRNKESITLYPNPASDKVVVQTRRQDLLNTLMILTDIQGKVVKNVQLVSLTQEINMAGLPGGIYFLRISDGSSYKIIRN